MKRLCKDAFEEIRLWVCRNARPIELALWKYYFENGRKEDVLSALEFYQNEDGGFGNALEPDNWNPNSSPYTTLFAINIMEKIDGIDVSQPMIQGIIKYLESGVDTDKNGWNFNIKSNDNYPHAPWWTYDQNANEYESIGVTIGIIDFILLYVGKESELYKRALALTEKLAERLLSQDNLGEMSVQGYCQLKDILVKNGLCNKIDMNLLSTTVSKLVNNAIERDSSKWIYHCKTPRDFILSPNSEFYKDNIEITQQELDYILATRQEDGVWGINWSWFDNNDRYPKEFAISENWWKSYNAIENILHLRNFDRVE